MDGRDSVQSLLVLRKLTRAITDVVRVITAADEMRHPNLNRVALESISNSSGGQVVDLTDLASVPEKLKGEVRTSHLYREASIWDNWLTMLLLVVVYSVDVGLRRLVGLS